MTTDELKLLEGYNIFFKRNKIKFQNLTNIFEDVGIWYRKDLTTNRFGEKLAEVGDYFVSEWDGIDNSTIGVVINKGTQYIDPMKGDQPLYRMANGRIHRDRSYPLDCLRVIPKEIYDILVNHFFEIGNTPKLIKKETESLIEGSIFSTTKDNRFLKIAYTKQNPQSPMFDDRGFPIKEGDQYFVGTSNGLIYKDALVLSKVELDSDNGIDYCLPNVDYAIAKENFIAMDEHNIKVFKDFYKLF